MSPTRPLVIDTNVALDLWVFDDPAVAPLRDALTRAGGHRWLITEAMLAEARRVLDYPQLARRLRSRCLSPDAVMSAWRAHSHLVPEAPRAPYRCKDADDQKFVDLAVQHQAVLLSKDAAVLCMAKRLERVGAQVLRQPPQGAWGNPASAP